MFTHKGARKEGLGSLLLSYYRDAGLEGRTNRGWLRVQLFPSLTRLKLECGRCCSWRRV